MFWAVLIIGLTIWLAIFIFTTQMRSKTPVDGVYEVRPQFKAPSTRLISWLAAGFLVLLLLVSSIKIIPAGHVGVVFNAISGVKPTPLHEGFNLIIPGIESVTIYNARILNYTMSHSVGEGQRTSSDDAVYAPTKEGLLVGLDVTILYRIDKEKAPDLHRKIGPDYEDKIIRPETRNNIRMAVKDYGILDVYGTKREEIQNRIYDNLKARLAPRQIICLEVLLRDVIFPEDFAKSIRDKQVAQQDAQKMDYILEKEKKEAERKVIEAGGQARSIEIVQEALSKNPNYIQYLWATKLPQNVQTLVVPGGSNILINPQSPQ